MFQIPKVRERAAKVCANSKGETLLEVIISLALFAITILMTATMFAAANKVTQQNFKTEKELDQAVTNIVKEEHLSGTQNFTVTFQLQDGSGTTRSMEIQRVESEGLYKFREKPANE